MKNAIVFGATSGIGRSITEILIKEGYKVAVTGRRLEKLEELKNSYPNQILIKQNDIQEVEDVEKVFNEIVTEFTTIDLVIQSSGVAYINPKFEWDKENQSINTNVLGVTKLYTLTYNLFRKQQFGQLVGITSMASLRGNRSAPVYFASKAYQKAYQLKPSYGDAFWSLANTKTYRFTDAEISQMQTQQEQKGLSLADSVQLHFATGKAFEDRQEYKKAFNAILKAF